MINISTDIDIEALIEAVTELRRQFNGEKIEAKILYPGRRSGVDPQLFVLEQYGEVIRHGLMGSGRLQIIDTNLYNSLRARLAASDPPETMADFFSRHTDPGKEGTPYQRRIRACATVLGCSEEEAVHFFQGMRVDRIREATRRPRSEPEAPGGRSR
ncbi:MAG: hypothetical protein JHC96_04540 [Brevundimonas sp.]|uniref:hypothetical protein n=1 Tax=Brevundimonas sp. TaxID=1871086 RepID=UPI001A256310|nr:hypothetical protein [Brevundimonas sp.]MBJ7318049.1 hypothetical protein [Brevundimonas sp.]